jgi:hypothetical protein
VSAEPPPRREHLIDAVVTLAAVLQQVEPYGGFLHLQRAALRNVRHQVQRELTDAERGQLRETLYREGVE